jgi:ABC-type transporter Mla MlaB component
MPRESTRQFVRPETASAHLDGLHIQVSRTERTVRVALSGALDRQGVEKLVSRVAPCLVSRGCRIILDGSRLTHLDFRATGGLVSWHRHLRTYHHQLYLQSWSDYLKAILVMEDWERELGSTDSDLATWHLLGEVAAAGRP